MSRPKTAWKRAFSETKVELVVGIDFGTTHSGVSWAVNEGSRKIRVINDWPNPRAINANSDKVPSTISYEGRRVKSWGYQVKPQEKSFRWMKVLLETQNAYQAAEDVKQANALLGEMGKTAEDVVSDYLRALWTYTKEDIRKRVNDQPWEDHYTLQVIVTVPAVWSDSAKDKTLRAGKKAGLPSNITLMSEPEAAALATLKDKAEDDAMKDGDAFVVCDAGGGTVDLISYRIVTSNPLVLEECAIGDGDLCGSVFVDLTFEEYIKSVIGAEQYNSIKEVHRRKMLQDFEYGAKRVFTGEPEVEYTVDLRGVDDYEGKDIEIMDETMTIQHPPMQDVFYGVWKKINNLVRRQVESVTGNNLKVKAILLVGGFGESKFLHKMLETSYGPENIRVMQVDGAWSSICRGATISGLSRCSLNAHLVAPVIRNRLSRGSYGTMLSVPYDKKKHLEEDRCFDKLEGIDRAKRQMKWLLERGEQITEGRVIDCPVYETVKGITPISNKSRSFSSTLYFCDRDIIPTRWYRSIVRDHCSVTYSIAEAAIFQKCPQATSKHDGSIYHECHSIIRITLKGASLDFEVVFDGQKVASAEASYIEN